jgi:hypothetical protein
MYKNESKYFYISRLNSLYLDDIELNELPTTIHFFASSGLAHNEIFGLNIYVKL